MGTAPWKFNFGALLSKFHGVNEYWRFDPQSFYGWATRLRVRRRKYGIFPSSHLPVFFLYVLTLSQTIYPSARNLRPQALLHLSSQDSTTPLPHAPLRSLAVKCNPCGSAHLFILIPDYRCQAPVFFHQFSSLNFKNWRFGFGFRETYLESSWQGHDYQNIIELKM